MQNYDNHASNVKTVIVGLDVHKDTIAACVFDSASGELCHEEQLPNEMAKIRKLIQRIRRRFGQPRCCYEASSCGFILYRFLHELGVHCDVIASKPTDATPGSSPRSMPPGS